VDIERLLAENVLAAEQLRRIVAERLVAELRALVAELRAEKDHWKGMGNGAAEAESLVDAAILEG
jgi:hypothetical protein